MTAGRELDVLIAEKVMGCTVIDYNGRPVCGCKPFVHGDCDTDVLLWPYSTSIAAAWMVVEKVQDDQGPMVIMKRDERWCIWLTPYDYGTYPHDIEADTAPLAICKAALKAVECVR